jgi:hypothetical protein
MTLMRSLRDVASDWRVLGVSGFLILWTAAGVLVQSNVVLESAVPLAYVYLVALSLFGGTFPGMLVFWCGYVLFCVLVAVVLVGLFDWLRARWPVAIRE